MNGIRSKLGAVVTIAFLIVMASARPAAAETWVITVSIINQTSTGPASSCDQQAAPGVSCVELLDPAALTSKGVWADEPWWYVATASGTWNGTDTWQYTAPYLGWGADAAASYLMPDGAVYRVLVNDDVDQSATTTGASCGQSTGQMSAYVCVPGGSNWDTPSAFNASFTFVPRGQEQALAVGSVCAATISYATRVDCMDNGGWAESVLWTNLDLYNSGSTEVAIFLSSDTSTPWATLPAGTHGIVSIDANQHFWLGNLDTSQQGVPYQVQISAIGGLGSDGSGGWAAGLGDDFWNFLLNGELWGGDDDVVFSHGQAPDDASRELMRLNAPQQATTTTTTPPPAPTTPTAAAPTPVVVRPRLTG